MAVTTTVMNALRKRHQATRPAGLLLLIQAALLCGFSSVASADDKLFLPSSVSSNHQDSSNIKSHLGSLCNKGLAEQAKQMRSTEMSAEHRALNHQWLATHAGEERQYNGGRAASRIAQTVLREYWQNKRRELGDKKALLDKDGNLKRKFQGIDYGLTTSGGGLNIGLNYQF